MMTHRCRPFLPVLLAALLAATAASGAHARPASSGLLLRTQVTAAGSRLLVLRNRVGTVRVVGRPGLPALDVQVAVRPRCRRSFWLFEFFRWVWGASCGTLPAHPVIRVERNGTSLRLGLTDGHGHALRRVHADWTLTVPAGLALRLHVGVGAVRLADLGGDLRLTVGVGAVRAANVDGPRVTIHDGVGALDFKGLALPPGERFSAHVGVGAVRAWLAPAPGAGPARLFIHTGVGAVNLRGLPCHLGRLSATSGTGKIALVSPPRGFAVTRTIVSSSLRGGNGGRLDLRLHTGTGAIRLAWTRAHCP